MFRRTRNCYLLAVALALPSHAQIATGGFQGSVSDTSGAPVAGARISYSRGIVYMPPDKAPYEPAPGETRVSGSVTADAGGAFQVAGIPAGRYAVCVEAVNAPLLNPCKWSAAPTVTVSAGGMSRLSVVLQQGTFLKVRVDDPQGLLPAVAASPLAPPHFKVGVFFGTGAYVGAPLAGTDSRGRDFRMAVPVGVPLRLWLLSPHVTFRDASGAALDHLGTAITFQAVAPQDVDFRVTVSGRAPGAP